MVLNAHLSLALVLSSLALRLQCYSFFQSNTKTFTDDAFILVNKGDNESMEETVVKTMCKIENYMKANKMALNSDKRQVMLVSKDDKIFKKSVILNSEFVCHKSEVTILGNIVNSSLSWDNHVTKVLIPVLSNRV